jgi:hypothetical protein
LKIFEKESQASVAAVLITVSLETMKVVKGLPKVGE